MTGFSFDRWSGTLNSAVLWSSDTVSGRAAASEALTSSMPKTRIDQMLVDRGLAESRTRAQALAMAGLVFVGERKNEKAGQQVAADAAIQVRGRDRPWVSRGGAKLGNGLHHFGGEGLAAVPETGSAAAEASMGQAVLR